ncbi:MAG: hypothetical protein AAF171_13870 [Cyanobacteria bacterium P01_A01_bin.116]
MTEPITTAALVAVAASGFVGSAAKKAAEVVAPAALKAAGAQVGKLWGRIKQHFAGDEKAERAIAQVETEQSAAALTKLEVYLDDELADPKNQRFADELRQMAQQIINIGEQTQSNTTFNIEASDEARVNAVGEVTATTVNFGDGH